jgi:hypothetical protein
MPILLLFFADAAIDGCRCWLAFSCSLRQADFRFSLAFHFRRCYDTPLPPLMSLRH